MLADFTAKVVEDISASASDYYEFIQQGLITHPIPYFGNIEEAHVLTVGVNPSAGEFVSRRWPNRLTPIELEERLRRYFVSAPVLPHQWFHTWSRALAHLNVSYSNGAAHIDLSPRATIAMGRISNWQRFANMVERDTKWFFNLLPSLESLRLIIIAGCVTKRWYMDEFIERIAPTYGYRLEGLSGKSGKGRVGFLKLCGPIGSIPVFFCSVSPSGQNRQILIDRLHEHRCTIGKCLE